MYSAVMLCYTYFTSIVRCIAAYFNSIVAICLFRMRFIRPGVFTHNWKAKYLPFLIPISVFGVCTWYDETYRQETHRTFHNKSALYGGRDLKPGERVW